MRLEVNGAGPRYEIHLAASLTGLGAALAELSAPGPCVLVTNPVVAPLHADAAEAAWQKVALTARRFLQVRIDYGGAVPADPMVPRAQRLRRPLAEAFPGSRAAAAGAALAGLLDRPVALGTDPSAAWRALLVGEPAFGADPAQNMRAQAADSSPSSVSARTELVSR